MPLRNGTEVHIFGQVYRLRGGQDPNRVQRVAELVDRTMSRIADRGAAADSYRIAVLAALELADELVREQDEHERYRLSVEKRSDRLAALLERADGPAESERLFPAAD